MWKACYQRPSTVQGSYEDFLIESADLRSVFIEKDGADPNKQPWLEIICLSCQKMETLYPLLTTVLTIQVYTETIKFTSELLRFFFLLLNDLNMIL